RGFRRSRRCFLQSQSSPALNCHLLCRPSSFCVLLLVPHAQSCMVRLWSQGPIGKCSRDGHLAFCLTTHIGLPRGLEPFATPAVLRAYEAHRAEDRLMRSANHYILGNRKSGAMRSKDQRSEVLFSYVSLETRIPADHPLRAIREIVDEALHKLSPAFAR